MFDFAFPPGSRLFEVTKSVLQDLTLISNSDTTPSLVNIQKYDEVEDVWVGFKIGQVFNAKAHQCHLFFKWQDVRNCMGLENYTGWTSQVHIGDNLAGE